jgi:hypothetical protein
MAQPKVTPADRTRLGGKRKQPAPIGPRTRQRRAEYVARCALLLERARAATISGEAYEGPLNPTVAAVRAQTELNERDRASRRFGGPGVEPLTYEQRRARYARQNYWRGQDHTSSGGPLTIVQKRQLRRTDSEGHHDVVSLERPDWRSTGWTWPKGHPTMPRIFR